MCRRLSHGCDKEAALTTIHSAVIPGRRASGEPGIHNPRLWLWIPGLRLSAHPGNDGGESAVVPRMCARTADFVHATFSHKGRRKAARATRRARRRGRC
jgi:hypothetical protein